MPTTGRIRHSALLLYKGYYDTNLVSFNKDDILLLLFFHARGRSISRPDPVVIVIPVEKTQLKVN
jgi:hypothetical protein